MVELKQYIFRIYEFKKQSKKSFDSFFGDLFNNEFLLDNFTNEGSIKIIFGDEIKEYYDILDSASKACFIGHGYSHSYLKTFCLDLNENYENNDILNSCQLMYKAKYGNFFDRDDSSFITLIYEKDINNISVDNEEELNNFYNSSIAKANKFFDLISLYLNSIIDTLDFNAPIINNGLFLEDSKDIFHFLKIGIDISPSKTTTNPLKVENFNKVLNSFNQNNDFESYDSWMEDIPHLFMLALYEDNKWIKYYLNFTILESLIEIKFDENYENYKQKLTNARTNNTIDNLKINDKLKNSSNFRKKDFYLADKFYFISNDDSIGIDMDLEKFKKLKEHRNSMSHGRSVNINELDLPTITTYINKLILNFTNFDELNKKLYEND